MASSCNDEFCFVRVHDSIDGVTAEVKKDRGDQTTQAMSYQSGRAALNLELTDKVPRVEYSADSHWDLVKAVTGIDTSIPANREKARREFIRLWDYAFLWSTDIGNRFFEERGGRSTHMGHAVYAELEDGRSDYDDRISKGFESLDEIYDLDLCREYGEFDHRRLVRDFEHRYGQKVEAFPDTVNMGGVYITLISGFISLFGWEMMLLAMGDNPNRLAGLVERYYLWVKQFFDAYADSTVPVIMCHDDICWSSGPFAHPDWYRRYVFPCYKKLWAPIKEAGKKLLFTSDGDCTLFFDDIVACGADALVMEPLSDMALFAGRYGKTRGFVGNADTRVLLHGSKEDIYREVGRCMRIGEGCPGFIMAVGNHIPQNTPVDNALYYNEAYEKLSRR
jgi:hypothetical protein